MGVVEEEALGFVKLSPHDRSAFHVGNWRRMIGRRMNVLTGQLNRSERVNVLLLPGKKGAAETGGLMYLSRESGGRSRDEAVEILFS
jgi:hypothetical protein